MPKSRKTIPIYEYQKKVNGQTRYYIRPYVKDEYGNIKQITKRLDEYGDMWLGRDGYNKAIDEIAKLQKDIQPVNRKITISEAIKEYLQLIKPTMKERSFIKRETNYKIHIEPYMGNRQIFKITKLDIKNWKISMSTKTYIKGKKEHLYSLSHLNDIYADLSAIFNYCKEYYGMQENIVQKVGMFDIKERATKEKEIITEEELDRIISEEEKIIYKKVYYLLFYTGLRIGELCGLKIKNINLKENTFEIKTTLWQGAKDKSKMEDTPKTKNSIRTVPILEEVREIIQSLVEGAKSENDFLFGGKKYLAESTIRRRLNICLKKAGINKHITPHCLRHSFITICAKRNVRVDIVSKIVGHKHITTTYNIYTHVNQDDIKDFNNLFHRTRPKQDQSIIYT